MSCEKRKDQLSIWDVRQESGNVVMMSSEEKYSLAKTVFDPVFTRLTAEDVKSDSEDDCLDADSIGRSYDADLMREMEVMGAQLHTSERRSRNFKKAPVYYERANPTRETQTRKGASVSPQ
ncbi:hypothetical protein F443_07447 [Phytophthora nicotianae P1569]|uniref:Uncharacterized protein n=1 Tax=Phytophthora nicotianae P1569 TaxID=1317065 RepID=V9FDP1_PHYNI|nr:hypothetical protein F443_07447 [Phytophthora nicotianae P1569]